MQIGDLKHRHASQPLHRNAVFQAMAVVLSVGFVLAGWLVLSRPVQDAKPAQTTVAPTAPRKVDKPGSVRTTKTNSQLGVSDGAPNGSPRLAERVGDRVPPVPVAPPAPVASEPAAGVAPSPAPTPPPSPQQVEEQASVRTAPALDVINTEKAEAGAAARSEQPDSLVDLNTASLEILNSLPGAGPIGRAVINGRPYASAEELVTKKVLRRSTYEKIKDRVAVR